MDHANIARVLDAGTTDAGRPYFVMDLVRGVPITRYCDEHHLTPRQRPFDRARFEEAETFLLEALKLQPDNKYVPSLLKQARDGKRRSAKTAH